MGINLFFSQIHWTKKKYEKIVRSEENVLFAAFCANWHLVRIEWLVHYHKVAYVMDTLCNIRSYRLKSETFSYTKKKTLKSSQQFTLDGEDFPDSV